jgi:uncharacterized protein YkwD
VTLDGALCKGCRFHAHYLAVNSGHPALELGLNKEDKRLKGYTLQGEKAAKASFIAYHPDDPVAPLDQWMAMTFFRLILLDPDLRRIGFGCTKDKSKGWVTVFDKVRGLGTDQVVLYPMPNQKDVPLAFTPEDPNPIPEADGKGAGFPVTVTFPVRKGVRNVTASLKEKGDKAVAFWLSTPQKPAYKRLYQAKNVCLIPKEALKPATTYTVTVTAEVDDWGWQRWRKTWSFTTAGKDAPARTEKEVLDRVNAYRKLAGQGPVTLDKQLSEGCALHAEYLVKNAGHPSTKGLLAHDESPKRPGYTRAGEKAGQAAVIHYVEPLASVDGWMGTFFHRVPLLDPALKRIGFGVAKGGRTGWVTVLDVDRGKAPEQPTVYPGEKQKDVPLAYLPREKPDPIPESKDKKAGYPVTVSFARGLEVTGVSAELKEDGGADVPVWLSTPEKTVHKGLQRNSVCLIARAPLKPKTTYTVKVTAQVEGKEWSRAWSFTTGKE